MSVDLAFLQKVETIAKALDQLDYFQLLSIPYDADPRAIRAAYHKQSRRFHPDRYHHLNLAAFAADLTAISKRITEAYVVLRDDAKRQRYLEAVRGPQRASHLRFGEADEVEQKEAREAETGKTQQVRQLYHSARLAHANNDLAGAMKNLKLALMYEPDNAHFKQLLAQWQTPGTP